MHEGKQHLGPVPGQRHAAVGRLQTGDAAVVRGQADRAAEIAADAERREPGGDCGRFTPAGAAGGSLGVPGVDGATEDEVVRFPPERELGGVRLRDRDAPRSGKPVDDDGSPVGHVVGEEPGAAGRAHAGDVERVLDRERHAVQRTDLIAPSDGRLGLSRPLLGAVDRRHDRVQGRVDPLGPLAQGT